MGSPNWGLLYDQGRCKALGIPWSDEELKAVYELRIPVEYVRNGCLTLEEYENTRNSVKKYEEDKGEKPLNYLKRDELQEKASKLGIPVTNEATRADLMNLIRIKLKGSIADD